MFNTTLGHHDEGPPLVTLVYCRIGPRGQVESSGEEQLNCQVPTSNYEICPFLSLLFWLPIWNQSHFSSNLCSQYGMDSVLYIPFDSIYLFLWVHIGIFHKFSITMIQLKILFPRLESYFQFVMMDNFVDRK